jgi:hypothetical protein
MNEKSKKVLAHVGILLSTYLNKLEKTVKMGMVAVCGFIFSHIQVLFLPNSHTKD